VTRLTMSGHIVQATTCFIPDFSVTLSGFHHVLIILSIVCHKKNLYPFIHPLYIHLQTQMFKH